MITKQIFSNIDVHLIISAILLMVPVILCLIYLFIKLRYTSIKRKFTVRKTKKGLLAKIVEKALKIKFIEKIMNGTALRVAMLTGFSLEKNLEIAFVILTALCVTSVIIIAAMLHGSKVLWYVYLIYISVAALFIWLAIYLLQVMSKFRFTSKLPQTYKIINSRYISLGNILKTISVSLDSGDFDGPVRRVMNVIRDALVKNDMDTINNTFKMIEDSYKNEHLTLLLNLILQAHYKGGEEVIKQQFEEATDDVLLDMENQRDLSAASRLYVLLALLMPLCIVGIERFNEHALGGAASEFYASTTGVELRVLVILLIIIFVAVMIFMERT